MKHTPGPWTLYFDEEVGETNLIHQDDSRSARSGLLICKLPGDATKDPDARLIAASPDLYEAAKMFEGMLARFNATDLTATEAANPKHTMYEIDEAFCKAIAKAEGK